MNQEQIERRKAIKQAKRDFKETIKMNPVGFQSERVKLQAHAIDQKLKTRCNHSYEINNVESKRDIFGSYEVGQYQGNYTLGATCNLQIVLN